MYNYSPIKEIVIKNFRNLGDVRVNFEDSPIVTLVGENESGKTSIVKAFGVAAMHQNSRGQKDYIRDGTNGFGVAIELEDGTQVIRMKTHTANVYRVIYPDKTIWEAKKLAESGVPLEVQKVMGLIEEPETKELLQIRTYEDQLLFVVTPASTNYKVMYDALKISNLTKAIKSGTTEVNNLSAETKAIDNSILTLNASLSKIKIFDIEPLLNIKNKMEENLKLLDKLEKAVSLSDEINSQKKQLGALSLLDSEGIHEINELEISKILTASRLLENIKHDNDKMSLFNELEATETVDISLLELLNNGLNRKAEIDGYSKKNSAYLELSKVDTIDETVLEKFGRVSDLLESTDKLDKLDKLYSGNELTEVFDSDIASIDRLGTAINCNNYIKANSAGLEQMLDYIDKVIEWMKSVGVATTDCPRCGEAVVIDLDLLNKQ